jgi:cytochrome c oxidase subunit 4
MKRTVKLCILVFAFVGTASIAHAENINKAELAKKYDLAEGKKIYNESCSACHASGLLAAPKFCDITAWKPRMAQGMATMVKHAVDGFNAMPSKGGLDTLSIEQASNAVAYMVDQCLF